MCNRFENELPVSAYAERITYPIAIRDDARSWEPKAHHAITDNCLTIWDVDGTWTLGTAKWTFIHPKHRTPTFNTRTDASPKEVIPAAYRHEAPPIPNPMWVGVRSCWIPATSWLECPQAKKGKTAAIWYRMHLPGGEPFLMAGVCATRDSSFRMSLMMTESPAHIMPVYDRSPLVFGLDAIGQTEPKPIVDRIVSTLL